MHYLGKTSFFWYLLVIQNVAFDKLQNNAIFIHVCNDKFNVFSACWDISASKELVEGCLKKDINIEQYLPSLQST